MRRPDDPPRAPLGPLPAALTVHGNRKKGWAIGIASGILHPLAGNLMARTVGLICLPLLAAVCLAVLVAITYSSRDAGMALEARARQTVALLAGGVGDSLWNVDRMAARAILSPLSRDPDFDGVAVIDSDGSIFFRQGNVAPPTAGLIVERMPLTRSAIDGSATPQQIGILELRLTTERAKETIAGRAWTIALAGFGLLIVVCGMLIAIVRGVTAPIRTMTDCMSALADGRVDVTLPQSDRRDEIGHMAAALATLRQFAVERLQFIERQARQMEEIEEIVAKRTEQLSETLDTLQRAQDELIRSEKLAALGGMVAAIAHEINTPLGNGLTVATTLAEKIAEFRAILEGKELRRSAIRDYSENFGIASQLLVGNLLRASDLIGRFKRVAVDQTGEMRRRFELDEVCAEIVAMLRPTYKHSPVTIAMTLPGNIAMDSYPGALGQVLTNLVANAMVHAFADATVAGTIAIEGTIDDAGQHVTLQVCDDGAGIPAPVLPRIFDPFFTTKLGAGGSGLGLHIVYATVTRVLGGVIAVESGVGQGTRFSIVLPLVAPQQDHGTIWPQAAAAT